MSDEKVVITISGNISKDIAVRIRDIGNAALDSAVGIELLKKELRSISSAGGLKQAVTEAGKFRAEMVRARTEVLKLGDSIRKADDQTKKLHKSSTNLGGTLRGLVGTFSLIFAAREWMQASDALTGIQNKLRGITADVQRQTAVQAALFDVANRTRSGVEAAADGFVRFSKAMQGSSDKEVIRFIETLNKSLITAGRSAGEVNSVMIQLGQALTSGRLMGDEFRSLSENLPRDALEAIAKQLNTTVENLKALSTEGAITTEVLRKAFASMADGVDAAFLRTIPTIEQALEVLNNKWIAWTSNTQGTAGLVAKAIMAIGDNLNIIIPLVAAFAAGWALVGAINIAAALFNATAALVAMLPVLWSNVIATLALAAPWAALAAVILTAVAAILMVTGQWDNFSKAIADAIKPVTDIATEIGILKKDAEKTAGEAVNLATSFNGVATSSNKASGEVANFASATQSAATKIVAANDSITRSYHKMTAARAAANDANYKDLVSKGGTSGSFTAVPQAPAAGTSGSSITTLGAPKKGYASGGSFTVRGKQGVDQNAVRFNASRGERVDVLTKQQQQMEAKAGSNDNGGPPVFIFNIQTPDVASFQLSRGQMANEMFAALTAG